MKRLILGMLLSGPLAAAQSTITLDSKRTINLIGEVGPATIPQAQKLLQLSETAGDIFVLINSPGGSVAAGEVFVQAIEVAKYRGVTVKCVVPIYAASMAFVIYSHCSERYAFPAAKLLFHPAATFYQGRLAEREATAIAKDLGKIDRDFQAFFLAESGIDESEMMAAYYAEKLWSARDLAASAKVGWINLVTDIRGIDNAFELQKSGLTQDTPVTPKYKPGQCLQDADRNLVLIVSVAFDAKGRPWYVLSLQPPLDAGVGAFPTPGIDAAPLAAVACPK